MKGMDIGVGRDDDNGGSYGSGVGDGCSSTGEHLYQDEQ